MGRKLTTRERILLWILGPMIALMMGTIVGNKPQPPTDISNNDKSSQQLPLDNKLITDRGFPLQLMDDHFKGCLQKCMPAHAHDRCESFCVCVIHTSVKTMSKEQYISLTTAVTMQQQLTPIQRAQIDKVMTQCVN